MRGVEVENRVGVVIRVGGGRDQMDQREEVGHLKKRGRAQRLREGGRCWRKMNYYQITTKKGLGEFHAQQILKVQVLTLSPGTGII